jgi:hypothetical protein
MICWQVGAYDQCRAYVAEARPLHAEGRRIARVVLLSAAAGLALADGDLDAAHDFGRQADLEATELGVEREVPLIRAVLAWTLLARGEPSAAIDRALAALDAAAGMTVDFPRAICLETAALVAADRGGVVADDLAVLLASADVIRERGDRPALPTSADALQALRIRVGNGAPADVDLATETARRVLTVAAG